MNPESCRTRPPLADGWSKIHYTDGQNPWPLGTVWRLKAQTLILSSHIQCVKPHYTPANPKILCQGRSQSSCSTQIQLPSRSNDHWWSSFKIGFRHFWHLREKKYLWRWGKWNMGNDGNGNYASPKLASKSSPLLSPSSPSFSMDFPT